ncbi:MAG: MobA/MobL family protein, partial [Clostridia bacterium]|nr:MobA/MobL family protein [Clostridia bacterium]
GITHDYTRKKHVIYTEVMLPPNAPREYADRSLLWNSVEWNETNANAQLARSIELALPAELNHEQNIALVRKLVQKLFVNKGMCADVAFHDKGDGNPHAHILLTMRPLTPDGKWGDKSRLEYILDADGNRIPARQKGRWKTRKVYTTDWDDRGNAERWRAAAADAINEALREAGFTRGFVDPRSYADQGVQRIPMVAEEIQVDALHFSRDKATIVCQQHGGAVIQHGKSLSGNHTLANRDTTISAIQGTGDAVHQQEESQVDQIVE